MLFTSLFTPTVQIHTHFQMDFQVHIQAHILSTPLSSPPPPAFNLTFRAQQWRRGWEGNENLKK